MAGIDASVAITPPDEAERLAAVRRYDILDTPPDGAFDRITALAARLLDAPIAIVSIVDHDRIWFKSRYGIDVPQIGRVPGLCASAILRDDPRILPDATRDIHAMANPLVAGDFGLRFYVGVPLRTYDGFNLGTLCVIDKEARQVSAEQIAHLKDLASVVMDQIELHRSAREAAAKQDALIKEINHRVSNSLQLVSSLLALQGRSENAEVAGQFKAAAGRVAAIASVHRRLYQSNRVSIVDFKQYLEDLCGEISISITSERGSAALNVSAQSAEMATERATALGLILNELITNAMKYAYPDKSPAPIDVDFRRAGDRYELSVSDQGVGVAPGVDLGCAGGLGMRLVRSLAAQVGGELSYGKAAGGRGTRVSISFT